MNHVASAIILCLGFASAESKTVAFFGKDAKTAAKLFDTLLSKSSEEYDCVEISYTGENQTDGIDGIKLTSGSVRVFKNSELKSQPEEFEFPGKFTVKKEVWQKAKRNQTCNDLAQQKDSDVAIKPLSSYHNTIKMSVYITTAVVLNAAGWIFLMPWDGEKNGFFSGAGWIVVFNVVFPALFWKCDLDRDANWLYVIFTCLIQLSSLLCVFWRSALLDCNPGYFQGWLEIIAAIGMVIGFIFSDRLNKKSANERIYDAAQKKQQYEDYLHQQRESHRKYLDQQINTLQRPKMIKDLKQVIINKNLAKPKDIPAILDKFVSDSRLTVDALLDHKIVQRAVEISRTSDAFEQKGKDIAEAKDLMSKFLGTNLTESDVIVTREIKTELKGYLEDVQDDDDVDKALKDAKTTAFALICFSDVRNAVKKSIKNVETFFLNAKQVNTSGDLTKKVRETISEMRNKVPMDLRKPNVMVNLSSLVSSSAVRQAVARIQTDEKAVN